MDESVFNYNVTQVELESLEIILDQNDYLKTTSILKKFHDLYALFTLRGEKSKAEEILFKVSYTLKLAHSFPE
jgi:hypothetical protein